jgi:hypothetical protein
VILFISFSDFSFIIRELFSNIFSKNSKSFFKTSFVKKYQTIQLQTVRGVFGIALIIFVVSILSFSFLKDVQAIMEITKIFFLNLKSYSSLNCFGFMQIIKMSALK